MQVASNINTQSNSTTLAKSGVIEKYLPIFATFWFFVVLDSYLIWNPLSPILHILPAILVVWGTFIISDKLSSSSYNRVLFLCVMLFYLWLVITSSSIGIAAKRSTDFIPLLCIVLWPDELILRIYTIIRKILIFFSIGASIMSVLILLGLNDHIPHLVLPPREGLHIRKGVTYHLYIFFIANCGQVTGVSARACGMMQEPGHFAIILGFLYLIERLSNQKLNYWIVIGGLMTFSSTFVLIAIFTEIHRLLSWKGVRSVILYMLVLLLFLIVLYSFLPAGIQDQIYHYAYGRNLENVVEAYNETSSLDGALDERASKYLVANYDKMSYTQYLVGGGKTEKGYCLSDYRGMILRIGIIGLILAFFSYLPILVKTPLKLKIALSFSFFLIILHRSWMLCLPYVYFLAYVAVITYRMTHKEHQ